jgi:plasmid stability protein
MDDFTINDIDAETLEFLRARARKNVRTLEDEVVAIFSEAVGIQPRPVSRRRKAAK